MRATYDKIKNLITVEMTTDEANVFITETTPFVSWPENGEKVFVDIPCNAWFYNQTNRVNGGDQPWGPNELRNAIRSTVANNLVAFDNETGITPTGFGAYRQMWNDVYWGLLRNVRLKFPNKNHPRTRLSADDARYRASWRRQFVKQDD